MESTEWFNLSVEISVTAVRVPEFILDDALVWFAQVKRTFVLRKITKSFIKLDHFESSFSPKYAVEVKDLLRNVLDD